MLELNEKLRIGSGHNRICYQHPNNPNLCVKVLHHHINARTQWRETRYFKHLQRANVSWDYVVPLIEMTPTSYGEGAVFELIRDTNGEISKTIDFYIKQNDPQMNQLIIQSIKSMKHHLLEQNIVFRDLNPLNLLLQQTNAKEPYMLKIIDGIGHNEFIPLCHMDFFAKRKIKRRWNLKLDYWFAKYEHIAEFITPYEDD